MAKRDAASSLTLCLSLHSLSLSLITLKFLTFLPFYNNSTSTPTSTSTLSLPLPYIFVTQVVIGPIHISMSSQLSRSRRPVIRQWHWYTISILLFISTPVFVAAHWPCIAPSPENLTQTFSDGFACIWILNFTVLTPPTEPCPTQSLLCLHPTYSHWHSLKQPSTYIYINTFFPLYPTLLSPPQPLHSAKRASLSLSA